MNATNSFQLIPTDQLTKIETLLVQINEKVSSYPRSLQAESKEEIFTTKEAMAFLKISHVNTFKNYMKKAEIEPINQEGPKRYLKSHLTNCKN